MVIKDVGCWMLMLNVDYTYLEKRKFSTYTNFINILYKVYGNHVNTCFYYLIMLLG